MINNEQKYDFRDFVPLIVIFSVIILFTVAIVIDRDDRDMMFAMRMFMAGFFLVFGFFKVINLDGFVIAYQKYDVIAKKSRAYGYIYPFIELSLGVAYFGGWNLYVTNLVTLVVMSISAVGVFQKLLEREEIPCACLGVVFKIPMTWVTLGEDTLMVLMALFMLTGAQTSMPNYDTVSVANLSLNQEIIHLEVVNTPENRVRGLSGRKILSGDEGMLFIFDEPEVHGIWMREMLFAIDIMWLDEEYKVVYIVEEATPESFPEVFRPTVPARFVIEATSGFVKQHTIDIGDVLDVSTQ